MTTAVSASGECEFFGIEIATGKAVRSRNYRSTPQRAACVRRWHLPFITLSGGRIRSALRLGAATVSFFGCHDAHTPVGPRMPSQVAAFVTGEAAASLDREGRLILPGALELPYPQITAERARLLADAFRRIHLPGIIQVMERDRGAGINPSNLRACGRVYYAEPAVEPLPLTAGPAAVRAYGPKWIVTLCGPTGVGEVSVAVAAYATDLRLENGDLVYPSHGGGFFSSLGIPVENREGLPGYPETAVASVVTKTGLRLSKTPRLVTLPRTAPHLSYWKLELERPARVRSLTTGNTHEVANVFFLDHRWFGHRGSWIAHHAAPAEYEYVWARPPSTFGERPIFLKSRIPARPGMPIKLEPVDDRRQ